MKFHLFGPAKDFLIKELKTISIEPAVALFSIAFYLLKGSQVNTNLLVWKICHLELNYSKSICDNLTLAENDGVQQESQQLANNFLMYLQWMSCAPGILFALIGGALSDEFGRKGLLLCPIFGFFIESFFLIANYFFIYDLPLEFFYVDCISSFFGGFYVYFIGTFGYITTITTQDDRVYRLARLEGVESLGGIVGMFLSRHIFSSLGPAGIYGLSGLFYGIALAYIWWFVKEPHQKKFEENNESLGDESHSETSEVTKKSFYLSRLTFVFRAIKITLTGFKSVVMKKRPQILKILIFIIYFNYGLYLFGINVSTQVYLYLSLVFDGFSGKEYALLNMSSHTSALIFLFFVVPFLTKTLKISPQLLQLVTVVTEALCYFGTFFANKIWQIYLVKTIGSIGTCKYFNSRTLLSLCIEPDEIGKAFSIFSVVAAIIISVGNPMFRQLYNKTLHFMPGAIFILFGSFLVLAGVMNMVLYLNRRHMKGTNIKAEQSCN